MICLLRILLNSTEAKMVTYRGKNSESVFDSFLTSKITAQDEDGYTIAAEVFCNGVDMWIRSQGDVIEII